MDSECPITADNQKLIMRSVKKQHKTHAKVVDRIRENPTKYLEEWMG